MPPENDVPLLGHSNVGLERDRVFRPAFDRRHPDPSQNYGIHGAEMCWLVHGPRGSVQFLLFTGWDLPHVRDELKVKGALFGPMPADLGYHADEPQYVDQPSGPCTWRPSGTCFYDGSGLNAEGPYEVLVRDGEDALYAFLEGYYREVFGEGSE